MSAMMLREVARGMAALLYLRRVFPVMHDGLNALVVFSHALSH